MVSKQEAFLKKLMATFRVEAADHLKTILAGLADLEWRQDAERHPEIMESVFREVHSLKGAARAVNREDIEMLCQALESAFAALKNGALHPVPALYDVLYEAMDMLELLLAPDSPDFRPLEQTRISGMISKLEKAISGQFEGEEKGALIKVEGSREAKIPEAKQDMPGVESMEPVQIVSATAASPEEGTQTVDTVRISTEKLNRLFRQTEELFVSKGNIRERHNELRELGLNLVDMKLAWTRTQAEIRKIQQLLQKEGESGTERAQQAFLKLNDILEGDGLRLQSIEHSLQSVTRAIQQNNYEFGGMIDNLLEEMKLTLFLPFSSLLDMYPHVVRRLARDSGKEVDFLIEGGGIEIDRRILEEIKDPLMHLLRNAIDHGIEMPGERLQKGKSAQGRIRLRIQQKDSGKVEILLEDDGAGIRRADVREAAMRNGLLSREEAERLNEEEELFLIFRSGLTTAPIITDLSGRGLGLAIVSEKIEKLGGSISVETEPDRGMTLRIALPLILATFRGILVEVGNRHFVVPTGNVERVARVRPSDIRTVENRETVRLYEETLSLVPLGSILGISQGAQTEVQKSHVEIAILSAAGTRLAFSLDRILGEQEFVLKILGGQLVRVRNIAGATVMGTGEVVPVLNVTDLIKSAVRYSETAMPTGMAPGKEVPAESERLSILVVEDSITSRTLIRNILEFAGYRVKTAVDGIDAMTVLRTDKFDLVVSDVEMPRMNGFDLTARIRADKKLADLPVVLVTALESREDRERGIDVGANAYIVKSSFDQSNLLDVIKRVA